MGDYGRQDSSDGDGQDILSKVIRAGKRTYFFDVKSTRSKDMYLVITESKRRFEDDGNPSFEKHKIFLYREDLQKFTDALHEVAEYIAECRAMGIKLLPSPLSNKPSPPSTVAPGRKVSFPPITVSFPQCAV